MTYDILELLRGEVGALQALCRDALLVFERTTDSTVSTSGDIPRREAVDIYSRRESVSRHCNLRSENYAAAVEAIRRSECEFVDVNVIDAPGIYYVFFVDPAGQRLVSAFCVWKAPSSVRTPGLGG